MSLNIRERVLDRSGGRCEACLEAPALYVEPYISRRPAWRSRAVCVHCRFRMMVRDGRDVFACDATPPMYIEDVRRRRR